MPLPSKANDVVAERRAIQTQMVALETKRNAFLRAQADKSGAKDGFDQRMVGALKKQATKNGFNY